MSKLFKKLNEQIEINKIKKVQLTESEKVELIKECKFGDNLKYLNESLITKNKKQED